MSKQAIAQSLNMLLEDEGWKVVEQYIKDRAADNRNLLMHCKTWEEVLQHRSEAVALESVLIYIQETINKGDEMDEEAST